jgi:hypothetical protein
MGLFTKRRSDQVIDLRDHVLEAQRQARSMPFEFGFPTKCPACSGRGYLDHIDPFRRKQYEHCPSCQMKWESSEDEVLALNL